MQPFWGAVGAEVPGQLPGVNIGDRERALAHQILLQAGAAAKVRHRQGQVADDQAAAKT